MLSASSPGATPRADATVPTVPTPAAPASASGPSAPRRLEWRLLCKRPHWRSRAGDAEHHGGAERAMEAP